MAFASGKDIEESCHPTDKAVTGRPEWTGIDLGGGFEVSFKTIGRGTLLTVPSGRPNFAAIARFRRKREQVIASAFQPGRPVVELRDFSKIQGSPIRTAVINLVEKLTEDHGLISGFVGFGASFPVRQAYLWARKWLGADRPEWMVNDYREAVSVASRLNTAVPPGAGGTKPVDDPGRTDDCRAVDPKLKTDHIVHKFQVIIANMADGYFEIDLAGRFTLINDSAGQTLGYEPEDLLGKAGSVILASESQPGILDLVKEVYETGEGRKSKGCVVTRKDGRKRLVEASFFPMVNSRSRICGFWGLGNDITDKKALESLRSAKHAAESASRAKSDFLANMSHEIRTPINGIIGMVELAMDTQLDDGQRTILETINQEAVALISLVNDILDFSKIEAEKLELEKIPFDIRYLVEDVAATITYGAEQKGLEFVSFLSPEVPGKLIGDPGRLRQILMNLAGNALKFTQKGEIYIKGESSADLGDRIEVRFLVKDTGIGISPEKIDTIFNVFTQADGSFTRRYGGTGLGTTISKKLVELMGGNIGVESKEGVGSTFWFTALFQKQMDDNPPALHDSVDLNDLKVLVADDNPTYRFVLSEYLRSWGCLPEEASGGWDAMELLKESAENDLPFQLVFIDVQMPGLSGFDLAQKIKNHSMLKDTPIIVLSSVGRIGDGKLCREIGIEGYLVKPIRRDDLHMVILSVLGLSRFDDQHSRDSLVTRHSLTEEQRKDVQILVVEDYPTNQQVVMNHLTGAGYQVDLAENGFQAVEMFRRKYYDLILMDVQMPVMDGFEATAKIRGMVDRIHQVSLGGLSPDTRRLPIIAMTAHAVKGDRERCLDAGMDDYMTKPLRRRELLSMVEKWMTGLNRHPDPVEAGLEMEPIETETEPERGDRVAVDAPMDWAQAVDEFEGDEPLLREVLDGFLSNVRKQVDTIRAALEDGDVDLVAREAHSIKGGAANLTANDLSQAAYELEKLGKSGKLEDGHSLLDKMENEFFILEIFAYDRESEMEA